MFQPELVNCFVLLKLRTIRCSSESQDCQKNEEYRLNYLASFPSRRMCYDEHDCMFHAILISLGVFWYAYKKSQQVIVGDGR